MPRLRALILLCSLVLVASGLAAPAQAHHRGDGQDQSAGGWEDDAGTDDGATDSEDEDGTTDWGEEDGFDDGAAVAPDGAPAGEGDGAGEVEAPAVAPAPAVLPVLPPVIVPRGRTVRGKVAYVRADGKAAIPRSAPKRVRAIIAAANQIVGKPYKWGGGHAKLVDRGYDCSGAVGYVLIRAGQLPGVMVSGQFARWASAGAGRWVSVHANAGHVYMEIAGLRLDTSPVADPGGRGGVRWRPVIGRRPGFHTRHPAGL